MWPVGVSREGVGGVASGWGLGESRSENQQEQQPKKKVPRMTLNREGELLVLEIARVSAFWD